MAEIKPDTALPLARPNISSLERAYVNDVMTSGRLSFGPQLEAFEDLMATTCGVHNAVAVSSGTAALHCIVRGLGIGEGDEIITTPYSFIASANVALFERARPVFVDIEPGTFNINPDLIETAITARTRAILAVDVFGCPARWHQLRKIAKRHDLMLIDDACEALGASVQSSAIGSWGDAAAFGFYPNKQITTGEGGCITTNNDQLAARCRSLRNQGRDSRSEMKHVRLGFNYRLDEMSAAVGRAQVERLDELLTLRSKLARRYQDALAPLRDYIHLPEEPDYGSRSWFVYVVRLQDHYPPDARDKLISRLKNTGISSAPYFPAIHRQPFYQETFGIPEGTLPVCESTADRTIALPFYGQLPADAPARVAKALTNLLPAL